MKLILPISYNHDSSRNKISNSSSNSGNIDTCKSGKICIGNNDSINAIINDINIYSTSYSTTICSC